MSRIPMKIITREEAIKNGWSSPRVSLFRGAGSAPFATNVMVKKGLVVNGKKNKDEVMQINKIDIKTGKKEIMDEKPEFSQLKKDLKIKDQ